MNTQKLLKRSMVEGFTLICALLAFILACGWMEASGLIPPVLTSSNIGLRPPEAGLMPLGGGVAIAAIAVIFRIFWKDEIKN